MSREPSKMSSGGDLVHPNYIRSISVPTRSRGPSGGKQRRLGSTSLIETPSGGRAEADELSALPGKTRRAQVEGKSVVMPATTRT